MLQIRYLALTLSSPDVLNPGLQNVGDPGKEVIEFYPNVYYVRSVSIAAPTISGVPS